MNPIRFGWNDREKYESAQTKISNQILTVYDHPNGETYELDLGFYLSGELWLMDKLWDGGFQNPDERFLFTNETKDKALSKLGGGLLKIELFEEFEEWASENYADQDLPKDTDWDNVLNGLREKEPDKYFQLFKKLHDFDGRNGGDGDWLIPRETIRAFVKENGEDIVSMAAAAEVGNFEWSIFIERETAIGSGNLSDGFSLNAEEKLRVAIGAPPGSGPSTKGDGDEVPLDDDKLTEKLQIVEQCALLTVASELRDKVYNKSIEGTNSLPHRGRVIPVTTTSPELLINKLTLPERGWNFFELTARRNSCPEIKSYRTYYNVSLVKEGTDGSIEDHILVGNSKSRDNEYIVLAHKGDGSNYDKGWEVAGSHVYLKNVDVTLAGTNPATARNDIKVKMSWKLSSMEWLDRPIMWYGEKGRDAIFSGRTFKISELITHPKFLEQSRGGGRFYRRQYHPSYNRIRLNVYNNAGKLMDSAGEKAKETLKQISKANVSIDLALVDHTIERDADKSAITLTIEYRGFLDTLMSMPFMDAMTDHEILDLRQDREKILEAATLSRCPQKEMRKIKRLYQEKMLEEIRMARTSLIDRLINRKKVYGLNMSIDGLRDLFALGYVKEPEKLKTRLNIGDATGDAQGLANVKKYISSTRQDIAQTQDEVKSSGNIASPVAAAQAQQEGERTINYFFLGDLIEVATDILFKSSTDGLYDHYHEEFKILRPRVVTGDFKYLFFKNEDSVEEISLNISAIPISLQWFMQWFQTNILDRDLTHVPISTFIKMITEEILNGLLAEECFGSGELENKLLVRTSFFTALEAVPGGEDILLLKSIETPEPYLDIDRLQTPIFEIKKRSNKKDGTDSETGDVKEYTNYIVVHAVGHNLFSGKLTGDPRKNNIPLIQQIKGTSLLEQDASGDMPTAPAAQGQTYAEYDEASQRAQHLVQTISFSKTDTKYLREARYANAATNHLTLLGNVYDVSIVMKGVTFLYPGQMIFVDPSIEQRTNAWEGRSIANQLGMAGYYLIQSVDHHLQPSGKTTTTVKAKWHNSGVLNDYRISGGSIDKINDIVYTELEKQCESIVEDAKLIMSAEEISSIADRTLETAISHAFSDPAQARLTDRGAPLEQIQSVVIDQQNILDNISKQKSAFTLEYQSPWKHVPTQLKASIVEEEGVIKGWQVKDENNKIVGFYNKKGAWVVFDDNSGESHD